MSRHVSAERLSTTAEVARRTSSNLEVVRQVLRVRVHMLRVYQTRAEEAKARQRKVAEAPRADVIM